MSALRSAIEADLTISVDPDAMVLLICSVIWPRYPLSGMTGALMSKAVKMGLPVVGDRGLPVQVVPERSLMWSKNDLPVSSSSML